MTGRGAYHQVRRARTVPAVLAMLAFLVPMTAALPGAGEGQAAAASRPGAAPLPWPANPGWHQYVQAPASRDVHPVAVSSTSGTVTNAQALVRGGSGTATLTRTSSETDPTDIVLDYGKDVGGIPYFRVASVSGAPQLHAAYSEALQFLNPDGDQQLVSPGAADPKRADTFNVTAPGMVTNGLIQGGERFEQISLTTPGSLSLSAAGIHFTAFRAPAPKYRGYFVSSSPSLNRAWYDGAYTVQLDQLPADTLPAPWTISDGSLDANGAQGNVSLVTRGTGWTDYTMSFQTQIVANQTGWFVRAPSANPGSNQGYLLILDDSTDAAGPPDTLQQLVASPGAYASAGSATLAAPLTSGSWHTVKTVVSGSTVTTYLDGQQIGSFDTASAPAGTPAYSHGTVGFREAPLEQARYRNLTVTDPSGTVLYSNPLSSSQDTSSFSGAFSSPDPIPVILDGAKRDRAVWSGDLSVEGPTTYYSTYASQYMRDSLKLLGSYQVASGEAAGAVLPTQPLATFPANGGVWGASYSMYQVMNTATYYLYTGDLGFVRREWPVVQRQMAWDATLVNSDGLIVTNSSTGNNWGQSGPLSGEVTSYNAIYYQTLRDAAILARALGHGRVAASYERKAVTVKAAINDHLFDPATGAYDVSSLLPGTVSQGGNSLAVLYGIAPGTRVAGVFKALRSQLPGTPYGHLAYSANTDFPGVISPFVTGMQLDALFAANRSRAAVALINSVWGHMDNPHGADATGTDWEVESPQGAPLNSGETSLAHGWSSAPTSALSQYVLGVAPLRAGYSSWQVNPHPGPLAWAQGQVPTPHGPIAVKWGHQASPGQFVMDVTPPAATTGTITVPTSGREALVHVNGKLVWNNGQFHPVPGITSAQPRTHDIAFQVNPGALPSGTGSPAFLVVSQLTGPPE